VFRHLRGLRILPRKTRSLLRLHTSQHSTLACAPTVPPIVRRRAKRRVAPCNRGIQLLEEKRREYLTIVEEEKRVIAPPPSLQAQPAENRLAKQGYEAPSTLSKGAEAETTFWSANTSRIPTSTTIVPSHRNHQRNRIPKPARQGPRT